MIYHLFVYNFTRVWEAVPTANSQNRKSFTLTYLCFTAILHFRFLCGENNHWASQGIKPRGQIMLENLGPKIQLSAVKEDRQSVKVTLGSLHFSQNVNTQIKRGKVIKRGKLIDCKIMNSTAPLPQPLTRWWVTSHVGNFIWEILQLCQISALTYKVIFVC